jgi:PAS domain S-box-containing protein
MGVAPVEEVTHQEPVSEDPAVTSRHVSTQPHGVVADKGRHSGVAATVLAATVPPLLAFTLQVILWSILSPFAWLLFYPAVFISSWLGGRSAGISAALISTAIAAWYFVPPERTLAVDGRHILAIVIFAATSIVVVAFHERLRRAFHDAREIAEELRESEERFRLTIDEAPIGMALTSLDGGFMRVNRVFCDIVGYSPEDLMKLRFRDITHPDDVEVDVAFAAQLARGEIARCQFEKRYVRKDGTHVAAMLSVSILRDRDGAPRYYITQVEDITKRKRAETALKDSEQRLSLALDAAHMGTWDLDFLTDTTVRSARHDQIFGYPVYVGPWGLTDFMNHVVPEDRGVVDRAVAQALKSGHLELECRIRRVDQSIRWISASGRAYLNRDGRPVRMLGTVLDITEHKRAEDALRASERDFRSLAESMPQIVWATDAAGLNIYFNQQWVDYTGLTLEQSYGEGWIIPFHPDDRQRAWDSWQRATKFRDTYSLECRLRRADGVYQWWLIRGVPLLDTNGEILKWFGTCTDIEHIKVAEQKLKESEAKFSEIVSISADAVIAVDQERRITIFNKGAEQIFGYSQTEAIGAPLDRLIPERFRRIHHRDVEGFASGDVSARRMGERRAAIVGLRKNGEEFPAEAAISKLQVGDRPLLTVTLRDVTERKRIEREQLLLLEAGVVLAASLDYERTLATVADLVVRDFADWCIVEIVEHDEQIRRLKVASADPSKSDVCAALEQMPIDRERPYLIPSVVDTKQPLLVQDIAPEHLDSLAQGAEHLHALRAVSPTSIMALPLVRHDQFLGVLAFLSSGPHHYRASDLRLAEALADRAAAAIENARLYRASVEAAQIRDQVLGIVAHDLRNPLGAITLQAGLLQNGDTERDPRSRKPADVIKRAAARMSRLIQDILDVSRMEQGHLSVEQKRVPTEQIVSEAVEAQRPLAASASIDLQLDLGMGVSDVWVDRDRVLQAFENLIGNAVRFTSPGGVITAGAASRNGEVMFWVRDTGAGISAEDMPHVFDRFWQARKARRAGAGLGLQIVKGIIEAHGGRIWVESTVGVGTTFYFTLPTARAAGAEPTQPELH